MFTLCALAVFIYDLICAVQRVKYQDSRAIARKPRDAATVRCGLMFAYIHYKFKRSRAPKARLQSYMHTCAKQNLD